MSPITSELPTHVAHARFSERLRTAGWRVKNAPGKAPRDVTFALLASRPDAEETRTQTLLIYAFLECPEVRVDDLWDLLCDAQRVRADGAVLCLGEDTVLSRPATAAATQLTIQVLRLTN